MSWVRVSKQKPCLICGRTDWCLISNDGTAVICPRVESPKRAGEGGYLHKLAKPLATDYRPRSWAVTWKPDAPADVSELARKYAAFAEECHALEPLADHLGLSVSSLRRLGVGWRNSGSSTWPLCDSQGRIVGINRRFADGSKKIMQGQKAGLYMPNDLPQDLKESALLICEGGSDTAAALDMDFLAVGRFSCSHGVALLTKLLRQKQPGRVVIVSDADAPGQHGAAWLSWRLTGLVKDMRVICPPAKDLRAWKQKGATREDVISLIEKAELNRLHFDIKDGDSWKTL